MSRLLPMKSRTLVFVLSGGVSALLGAGACSGSSADDGMGGLGGLGGSSGVPGGSGGEPGGGPPAGALIGVSMESEVGVLLDELPAEIRDRTEAQLSSE